jgi:hypothetical protein
VAYNLHYVTLFFIAHRKDEEQPARVLEPHKCEQWLWVEWASFPKPWFASMLILSKPVSLTHYGLLTSAHYRHTTPNGQAVGTIFYYDGSPAGP